VIQALLWLHQYPPQLLIASLWRSYAVLLIHKLLHPRCRVVCFLHCNRPVHLVDWLLAFGAMMLATEIWNDSSTTLRSRVPLRWQCKSRVISFVLQRQASVTSQFPLPRFVFWGRLAAQKGLDRALKIIATLKRDVANIQFQIIGPDGGERGELEKLAVQLGLNGTVFFLGPRNHEEIRSLAACASFYLQTSVFEGMAVSVVEAMQLGLVPVVTPVGEITRYCHDSVNALLANSVDSSSIANRIKMLIDDPCLYAQLRQEAVRTWADAPTYHEDVLSRCRSLLTA